MLTNSHEYQVALEELSELLDAEKPPPVGSGEALRFEYLLDQVACYEQRYAAIDYWVKSSKLLKATRSKV